MAQHLWRNSRRRGAVPAREQAYPPLRESGQSAPSRLFAAFATGGNGPFDNLRTGFGADVAFAQVEDKLVEHYGILLAQSTIRRVAGAHAQKIYAATTVDETWPGEEGSETVIVEMDGGMVPTVEADAAQKDRRKGKKLLWKEAKLCLAHEAGNKTLSYGGTLQGDVAEAGKQLFGCARTAGFEKKSQIHAVGDGADRIALQVDERFGGQGSYLVDFYHVCDYLSAAAAAVHAGAEMAKAWFNQQKERLKSGNCAEVIESLRAHLEADEVADSGAAVRACHRYLNRRQDQLDYPRIGQQLAHRFGGNRKRAPLHRAETAQTSGVVVVRRKRRVHSGITPEPGKPAMGQLLDSSQKGRLNERPSLNRTPDAGLT